ncbi:hypothetical protein QE390_003536 [Siphonobacter sp. SORGH_AS 1065]|nr:hypothetical protein [Siphonobacter sp. SORGH_AS_1065]
MPSKEVIEAMNWKDGIAFMLVGAFIWHLIFSAILALAKWKPKQNDRYSATSKREPWPAHDRTRIGYYPSGIPYNLDRLPPPPPPRQSAHQIQPPSQPPTEKPTRGR